MKIYLKSIVNQLKNYSDTLDKTSILIDKPWAMIDEEFELQKLIFKKDKELILSKNGKVQIGKWDYLPEAKSLLIDRGDDKLLCNEGFIDKGVMILRLDGTKNHFFVLANENIVPDLDAHRYLKELRYDKLVIAEVKLADGRILEVQREAESQSPQYGQAVSIDAEPVEDGIYQLSKPHFYYEIRNGSIFKILTATKYINPDNQEIIIHREINWSPAQGNYVFINGKPAGDGKLNFSKRKNLIVHEGKIVTFESKKLFTKWLSSFWR